MIAEQNRPVLTLVSMISQYLLNGTQARREEAAEAVWEPVVEFISCLLFLSSAWNTCMVHVSTIAINCLVILIGL